MRNDRWLIDVANDPSMAVDILLKRALSGARTSPSFSTYNGMAGDETGHVGIDPSDSVDVHDLNAISYKLKFLISNLQTENDQLRHQLAQFIKFVDGGVNNFMSTLISEIVDDKSAFAAAHHYTSFWFRRQAMSSSSKCVFAGMLIKAVSGFNPRYVQPLWMALADHDEDAISQVDFEADDVVNEPFDFVTPMPVEESPMTEELPLTLEETV